MLFFACTGCKAIHIAERMPMMLRDVFVNSTAKIKVKVESRVPINLRGISSHSHYSVNTFSLMYSNEGTMFQVLLATTRRLF